MENVVLELHRIGAIKFGEFKLKSGILSPIYIDLRLIISYPKLLQQVADLMWEKVKDIPFDCICGVPYTALPIAAAISLKYEIPMVMRRKEAKNYGMRQLIEGKYQRGDRCLVLEDLITSGSSIFETIEPLKEVGLQITNIVVFLDREQGGKTKLEENGYTIHSVLKLNEMLSMIGNTAAL